MSKTLSIREVRADLANIIDRVESGQRVVLTRRGKAVAEIVPLRAPPQSWPNFKAIRARIKPKGEPLSQIVSRMRDEARY